MKTNPPCTLSRCALLNLVSPWMSSLHWYKPVLKTLALCSWYTKSSEEPIVLVYTILSFFNMVYSRISPLPVLVLTVAWHLRVTLVPAVTSFLGSMISSTLWILNSMKWDLTKSVRTHLSNHISSAYILTSNNFYINFTHLRVQPCWSVQCSPLFLFSVTYILWCKLILNARVPDNELRVWAKTQASDSLFYYK